MENLETYVFEGKIGYMTFSGPKEQAINFNLIVAPDVWSEHSIHQAAKALSIFLTNHYSPVDEDEGLDEDVCYN
jgi:hypothetical protein